MTPDFKYYARPGSQHQPCLQCTGHDPTYCPSYKSCVYYKSWLKQCWNAFRKATGIKRRCSA